MALSPPFQFEPQDLKQCEDPKVYVNLGESNLTNSGGGNVGRDAQSTFDVGRFASFNSLPIQFERLPLVDVDAWDKQKTGGVR